MATTVNMHEAKTHLSKLVERAAQGEEIIIAKAGKPLVRIVPINGTPTDNPRMAGWGKDLLKDVDLDAMFNPEIDKEIADLMINGPLFPDE